MGARHAVRTPMRAWRMATGDRARMVVRKGGPRRMNQRAQAGLGVRVRRDRDAGDTQRRRGRRVPERPVPANPFQVALFDRANLHKVEQKWSEE
jgi:hypothetical protein